MNNEKLELLEKYLEIGTSPLLIKNIEIDKFNNSVTLDANIDGSELNGHYENIDFCPPDWYKELLKKSKNGYVILHIKNIDSIEIEEQNKPCDCNCHKREMFFDD